MAKTRTDLEYEVVYSMRLEKMTDTLLGRIDRISNFLQIFLGLAIVTTYAPITMGIVIAAIAVAQMVWQFSVKSFEAKTAFELWQDLEKRFNRLTNVVIEQEMAIICKSDSRVTLASLRLASDRAARVKFAMPLNDLPELSMWQKFVVYCAS